LAADIPTRAVGFVRFVPCGARWYFAGDSRALRPPEHRRPRYSVVECHWTTGCAGAQSTQCQRKRTEASRHRGASSPSCSGMLRCLVRCADHQIPKVIAAEPVWRERQCAPTGGAPNSMAQNTNREKKWSVDPLQPCVLFETAYDILYVKVVDHLAPVVRRA
jgi:hypothetical protein